MDNLLRKRFYLLICFGYMSNHYFEMDIYKSITAPRQLKKLICILPGRIKSRITENVTADVCFPGGPCYINIPFVFK